MLSKKDGITTSKKRTDCSKEWIFKIGLLGDPSVGKTSLIKKYVQHQFSRDYKPTLGVNIVMAALGCIQKLLRKSWPCGLGGDKG